jgi:hypothetical protein
VAIWAADPPAKVEPAGYIDADGDGKNDVFRDANGDGLNDVTGKPYSHQFKFVDRDGDGVNDVFCDADGDGENDLAKEEKNTGNKVIDFDGDGINDVTGKKYDIAKGKQRFIDEDGDGIRDETLTGVKRKGQALERRMDGFIDSDGDGINDGRGFKRERRELNNDLKGNNGKNNRGDTKGEPAGRGK